MSSTLSIPILCTKLPGPDLSAEGTPGILPVQVDICTFHSQRSKDGSFTLVGVHRKHPIKGAKRERIRRDMKAENGWDQVSEIIKSMERCSSSCSIPPNKKAMYRPRQALSHLLLTCTDHPLKLGRR